MFGHQFFQSRCHPKYHWISLNFGILLKSADDSLGEMLKCASSTNLCQKYILDFPTINSVQHMAARLARSSFQLQVCRYEQTSRQPSWMSFERMREDHSQHTSKLMSNCWKSPISSTFLREWTFATTSHWGRCHDLSLMFPAFQSRVKYIIYMNCHCVYCACGV